MLVFQERVSILVFFFGGWRFLFDFLAEKQRRILENECLQGKSYGNIGLWKMGRITFKFLGQEGGGPYGFFKWEDQFRKPNVMGKNVDSEFWPLWWGEKTISIVLGPTFL